MSRKYKFHNADGVYFVSFAVQGWVDVFTRNEYKNILVENLDYCQKHKGLELFAWCIMTNHVHLIVRAKEGHLLPDILRDFKKFTSKAIIEAIVENQGESRKEWMLYRFRYTGKFDNRIKTYKFCQETNHAILLDNTRLIEQRINYTHENPVRAMIVSRAEDYLYSSARDYAGEKGFVNVQTTL
ncbi:transposase [uncultured Sunxiuqinia sp.]|uniref:REP-associated tyrosine transposase n=1 Tax=uncultured Sunxiuqinia sp. TaxID=1573825 RepID=UPI002AA6DB5A|nr:transposase [uncultured Sunxiuqinia sp.]